MDQVRALSRLRGALREILRVETREAAKRHAIASLCQLVGGAVGAIIVDDDHGLHRRGRVVAMDAHNLEGSDLLAMANEYLIHGSIVDPALKPLRGYEDAIVTLTRAQLVDDSMWFGSAFVSERRRAARLGEAIYSKRATDKPHVIDGLCINRPWGDRPFDDEDRNLVHLFQLESAWLFERPRPHDARADALPPRQRETLRLLLHGASEKEIASRLDLSQHTVHGYVKNIYAHFGMTSRAQLLSTLLGDRPAGTS
ncbi:MAG TPA: LuxR C-terminal-related transcriptional regulator [Polyangia bacterium]|nr:LuxR C-terminal-related transcriptional regulator [Polyangia bacterium]